MSQISFANVDLVFGPKPKKALSLLDQGQETEKIFKETENFVAVKNVSLSVKQGDIFVLMGLSGSGKSSLLRCINGLNKATRGDVIVNGINVAKCKKSELINFRRKQISMVFQHFSLMPWRTVKENVEYGLELSRTPKKRKNEVVLKNLELVGLEKWKDYFPHQLSGGMQQRVGLARALSTGAEILLMDEPFSALDPLIRAELQNELLRLQKELKKTIVFVSHDLKEALRIANYLAIMHSGEIVQIGKPEEIVANPVNDYVKRFVSER